MPTPRLGAPELVSGQAVPETTVNEQAFLFDAFACPHFKDRDLTAPPGSPAAGDCYLVAASPTGAWTGQAGKVAIYINTSWTFITPKEGFLFWVDDENVLILYDGSAWSVVGLSSGAFLQASNNLSDVSSASTARTNLAVYSKTEVDNKLVGMWDLRGSTDCSSNPNYPAASKGDAYVVTVAGKIGGASGQSVSAGDVYVALADNAGGTQAAVGSSWDTIVHASVAAGGGLLAANNLSDVASAATARTNLGATTIGANIFTLANPSAITFPRYNADNSVSTLSASAFRSAIGAGTGDLLAANNLSDVASASTARTNLGLAIGTNVQAYSTKLASIAANTVSSQTGTAYTAVLGDADTYIRFSNASAITFTIPPNSSVAFQVGTVIEIEQAGAGALSVAAGSGVTINSRAADLTLAGQYAVAFLKKVATDTWTLNGDL